jgi:hypothetical protein
MSAISPYRISPNFLFKVIDYYLILGEAHGYNFSSKASLKAASGASSAPHSFEGNIRCNEPITRNEPADFLTR